MPPRRIVSTRVAGDGVKPETVDRCTSARSKSTGIAAPPESSPPQPMTTDPSQVDTVGVDSWLGAVTSSPNVIEA